MKFFTNAKPVLSPPHAGFAALRQARFNMFNASQCTVFAVIFTLVSMTAFSQSGEKWATGGNSINANSFFGTLNSFPINFKTNNVQRMTLTPAGFLGLGTPAPTVMFECAGDGKIFNFNILDNLIVGNSISVKKIFSPNGNVDFDGSSIFTTGKIKGYSISLTSANSHITSATGTVDFDGNNLSTSGTIYANNISVSNFTNPVFAGSGNGIVTFDNNGTFQKLNFNNDSSTVLFGNGTFGNLPENGWSINGNDMYSLPTGNIGIGTNMPIEKLDIDGNANIRGTLYVQNGVIIGQRVNTQKVFTDSLKSGKVVTDKITSDSIVSTNLKTEYINTNRAQVSNVIIDGITNNITTPGNITAGNIMLNGSTNNNSISGNLMTQSIIGSTPRIESMTESIDFVGTNLITTGNIKTGSITNLLFAGAGNGIVSFDNNGYFQSLSFDGNHNSYLRGDGTFGNLSGTSTWDTIYANAIIGGYVNATKSIQLDGSITAGSRGTGTIGEYSIVVGGPESTLGYPKASVASGKYSVSFGAGNESTNLGSMSFGGGNISSGLFSFAIGANNTSSGNLTVAIGSGNTVTGSNTTVTGKGNIADGKQSAIIGGTGNTLSIDAMNSAIIGGTGINATLPNTVYVPNFVSNGNVGIGIDSPIEKLDVNGNANIRGYLYVQDGVIIGRRIDGQRVNSDTIDVKKLAIRYATTDSLTSLKLATEKMAVSRDINIGERAKIGSNIVIDGLTNNITTPGNITAGTITAGNLDVQSQSLNTLNVSGGIKVGNSSIIIGDFTETGTADNNIYTENSDLFIQSFASSTNNTIINNNDGNVGIGTTTPYKKLTVNGDVSFANYYSGGTDENPSNGMSAFEILGNNQVPTRRGISLDSDPNGNLNFWIHTWQSSAFNFMRKDNDNTTPDATNLMTILKNGDIGIGTDDPKKRLHVKTKVAGSSGAGQYLGSIRVENEVVNLGTTSTWDLEPIVENNITGLYTRFSIGTPENTGMFTIKDDGNVGIGTSTPSEKLHIKNGSIYIEGEGQGLIVNEGGHKRVGFMKYANREAGIWRVANQDFEIGRLDVSMLPGSPSIFKTDIYVSGDGKVGIGTTNPHSFANLEVIGAIRIGSGGNDGDGTIMFDSEHQIFRGYANGKWDFITGMWGSNAQWDFYSLFEGNFGIGTWNPGSKLTVQGNANTNDRIATFTSSDNNLLFFVPKAGAGGHNGITKAGDKGIFWSDNTGVNSSAGFVIAPWTSGGTASGLRIDNNGNVGIGTNNPQTNLHISGTGNQVIEIESTDHNSILNLMAVSTNGIQESQIQFNSILRFVEPVPGMTSGNIRMSINSDGTVKVAGSIHAEEIEVTATVAPDYVFAPDYKLSTLQEIEKYIKQNSHLPDVPSAKEFQENGQNLGEMNFILLKKVEELTLHLIEQNKQFKALEEEIIKLKNK